MSYVGNKPALNYVNLAVQHFTTSATATYTLNQSVSDEVDIALFINNVRQQPGSSYAYTASGTTLTLSQATAGSDTMYCVFLGKAVETVNPPAGSVNTSELVDNAVTTAKITSDSVTYDKIQDLGTANRVLGGASTGTVGEVQVVDGMTNFVSTSSAAGLQIKGDGTTDGTLQLNCSQNSHGIKIKSPPHSAGASYTLTFPTTDGNSAQFLQTNGSGVLTWADAGGGITEADQWRITANITSNQEPISSNLERNDSTGYGRIGTGITESSGIFSFGSTGIYKVSYTLVCYPNTNDDIFGDIQVTTNNSSYSSVAEVSLSRDGNGITTGSTFALVDVTDTSNVKVRFIVTDITSGSTVRGDSSKNKTFFEFIRLGDT